jgi:hypothetical protein
MSRSRKSKRVSEGRCYLCGAQAVLTKEHIPPRSALGKGTGGVRVQSGEQMFGAGGVRVYQSGFHSSVLCETCNRLTGSRYGTEFAKWSAWGREILRGVHNGVMVSPPYLGYPARIAKQIVSTMIASAGSSFADRQPRLRQFVLEPEFVLGEDELNLSVYLCTTLTGRSTGVASMWTPGGGMHVVAEVALPPFGYLLTLTDTVVDARPLRISWFATVGYDEQREIRLNNLPLLPVHEGFPADYRSKDEIRRDIIVNILEEQGHDDARAEADRMMACGLARQFLQDHGEDWDLPFGMPFT